MNQILATENEKNKKKQTNNIPQNNVIEPVNEFNTHEEPINNFENTYEPTNYSNENNYFDLDQSYQSNNYSNKQKNTTDSKKIIIIFAIIIIVFGLAIGGVFAFNKIKDIQIKKSKPEASIEEFDGNAKISAFCKKGIKKVTYYWNEEDKTEIPSSGQNVEKLIELPKGENTLTVVVEDSKGQETKFTKSFSYYKDKEKPEIKLSIVETDATVKITATDETEIKELTYQWNEDEPVTVYPEEEGTYTIEEIIEIKRGKNVLKITATDTSKNTTVEEKPINGVNKPEIELIAQGEYLIMIVSHDLGLKKVQFIINSKEYVFDDSVETYEEEKLLLRRRIKLKEGENTIEVRAYSVEDTDDVKKSKYEYTPSN